MDSSMKATQVSIALAPIGVYDIDALRIGCRAIGVTPTRPNIRRFRRGKDLYLHGNVSIDYIDGITEVYSVRSQTYLYKVYTVRKAGSFTTCPCPDSAKGYQCKHQMAVLLHKHEEAECLRLWGDLRLKVEKLPTFMDAAKKQASRSGMLADGYNDVKDLFDEIDEIRIKIGIDFFI